MDGAHLIFKEWIRNEALKKITFFTTTFTMQVHGLPPLFIHEGMAEKIGNMVGQSIEIDKKESVQSAI